MGGRRVPECSGEIPFVARGMIRRTEAPDGHPL